MKIDFERNRLFLGAVLFLIVVSLASLFASVLSPFSFEVQDANRVLMAPNKINFFGTDSLGRDLFSRVLYGGRVSLIVAIWTSLFGLLLGVAYGALAVFSGPRIEGLMMGVLDVVQSLPPLVLMILVSVIFSSVGGNEYTSLAGIMAALSLVSWVGIARLVRSQVKQLSKTPFVDAARAMGAPRFRIFYSHILPNMAGPLFVMLTFQIPNQVLYESFLSFIGLGLQPPYSSWGVLANEGWRSFNSYPHLILFPGAALFLTMMSFNIVGDGLREILDPRSDYNQLA